MRAFARLLVVIEAFVCFGPLLLLLCLGLLFAPFWFIGLTLDAEIAEPVPPWDFLYPFLLVVFGMLGTFALFCVVLEITAGKQCLSARAQKWLFVPGVIAVLMFNWLWVPTLLAGEMTFDAIWPVLIYLVLPVAGSIHLFWLAPSKP